MSAPVPSASSSSSPLSPLRHRPSLFDVEEAQPSPPYTQQTFDRLSTLPPPDSPAYKSTASFAHDMPPPTLSEDEHNLGTLDKKPPMVHYPSDVKGPPSPDHHGVGLPHTDTVSSRASSVVGTDDEDDDGDDYDWSGEEDLVDEEAKFEKSMTSNRSHGRRWGFRRILSFLLGSLIGSIFTAGLLVTGPILLRIFWYNPHKSDHRLYVLENVEAWLFWAAAQLIVSWFLALIVDIVPPIVSGIISITWGHVSEYVKTRLELYIAVKNNIKPAFYGASAWVSWTILFQGIFKLYNSNDEGASRASYTPRVSQVIELLFFLCLVISIQRIMFHFIAFTFHRVAFKERVDTVNEALQVIEVLRNYKPKTRPPTGGRSKSTPGFSGLFGLTGNASGSGTPRGSRTPSPAPGVALRTSGDWTEQNGNDATLVAGRGRKGKQAALGAEMTPLSPSRGGFGDMVSRAPSPLPNSGHTHEHTYPPPTPGSASPMNAGHNRGGSGSDADAADVALRAAKALGRTVLLDTRGLRGHTDAGADKGAWDVTSAHEAKRLARALYQTFRPRDQRRSYLLPADFEPAFATSEAARAAFRVFDKDDNGDLSRAEIKTTLMKVYKERRSLSRSMRDVGLALGTLNKIIFCGFMVIVFFISLSVFRIDVTSSLTSLYTLGIAMSFIFKSAASNAFDAIMFLFVTHPFDTGDRCFIDDENLVVKRMGLFATVFTRSDGTETYYFNSQLFSKFIVNCRRSAKTAENLSLQMSWKTPLSKIDELEQCMNQWLETEPNRWFTPPTSVTLQHIVNQRSLECTVGIGHNGTWQDWGLRMARRTAFHAAVNYYCNQLGITLAEAPLPLAWADAEGRVQEPEDIGAPPLSPGAQQTPGADREEEMDPELFAPALGFAPPESQREKLRLRARKRSRKAGLQAIGADMG